MNKFRQIIQDFGNLFLFFIYFESQKVRYYCCSKYGSARNKPNARPNLAEVVFTANFESVIGAIVRQTFICIVQRCDFRWNTWAVLILLRKIPSGCLFICVWQDLIHLFSYHRLFEIQISISAIDLCYAVNRNNIRFDFITWFINVYVIKSAEIVNCRDTLIHSNLQSMFDSFKLIRNLSLDTLRWFK